MGIFRTSAYTAMIAGCFLSAAEVEGWAQNTTYDRLQNQLLSRRTGVNVRTIENRRQRMDFQADQQRFREEDRASLKKPLKLKVPTVKPTCQLPINGNAYIGARCR